MLLKEFEFTGQITDVQEKELLLAVREEEKIYLTVECFLPFIDVLEGIRGFREVLGTLADEENVYAVKAILVMQKPYENEKRIIKVKLFDNETVHTDLL